MKHLSLILVLISLALNGMVQEARQWTKHEISFSSNREYENPIYAVKDFKVTFVSPSGRTQTVRGFWDGGKDWKVRFMPDETGTWNWTSECTDKGNSGLQGQSGSFICQASQSSEAIYQKGAIRHRPGQYFLSHADGTPFFWLACTAWNGALKSTDEEWQHYLNQRKANQYNVIQLVTTEWRGCDKNAEGLTAIEGSGYIRIHPEFFKRIDQRIDEANAKGFVVSPVILWALPSGPGRHLSPGYTLPLEEAVILAKYIVARYQGNQVIWALGGDGRYVDEQELRWKEIGRRVFLDIGHAPVTLHSQGSSWIGELYAAEDWYDLMAYQSSHDNGERVVNWINQGPMSQMWSKLKPMPYINMEPNYEEIHFKITDQDVRNASYWSLFATPVAGITYGANGVWPWLAEGEPILNHSHKAGVTGWRKSIEFPGSIQMSYLAGFFRQLEWWNLFPANEILADQPGEKAFNQWVSVLKTPDHRVITAYIPKKAAIELFNPGKYEYTAQWFDPVANSYQQAVVENSQGRMRITQNFDHDMLIVLKRRK